MLIGYARVRTQDQNLELQRDALKAAGCEKVYKDKISGVKAARPGLDKALEHLRVDDTLRPYGSQEGFEGFIQTNQPRRELKARSTKAR